MYQTIIRDSGGEGLIRVVSVPCGPGRAVVNGSLLIVPPGTVAYAAVKSSRRPTAPDGTSTSRGSTPSSCACATS